MAATALHDGSEHLLRQGELTLDPARFMAWRNERAILLTAFQVQLLELLMRRPDHVFTRDELQAALWQDRRLDMANLRTCVRRLRGALNRPGERELVRNVRQHGYVLDGPAEAPL
jgi:two-component system response regulator MprA